MEEMDEERSASAPPRSLKSIGTSRSHSVLQRRRGSSSSPRDTGKRSHEKLRRRSRTTRPDEEEARVKSSPKGHRKRNSEGDAATACAADAAEAGEVAEAAGGEAAHPDGSLSPRSDEDEYENGTYGSAEDSARPGRLRNWRRQMVARMQRVSWCEDTHEHEMQLRHAYSELSLSEEQSAQSLSTLAEVVVEPMVASAERLRLAASDCCSDCVAHMLASSRKLNALTGSPDQVVREQDDRLLHFFSTLASSKVLPHMLAYARCSGMLLASLFRMTDNELDEVVIDGCDTHRESRQTARELVEAPLGRAGAYLAGLRVLLDIGSEEHHQWRKMVSLFEKLRTVHVALLAAKRRIEATALLYQLERFVSPPEDLSAIHSDNPRALRRLGLVADHAKHQLGLLILADGALVWATADNAPSKAAVLSQLSSHTAGDSTPRASRDVAEEEAAWAQEADQEPPKTTSPRPLTRTLTQSAFFAENYSGVHVLQPRNGLWIGDSEAFGFEVECGTHTDTFTVADRFDLNDLRVRDLKDGELISNRFALCDDTRLLQICARSQEEKILWMNEIRVAAKENSNDSERDDEASPGKPGMFVRLQHGMFRGKKKRQSTGGEIEEVSDDDDESSFDIPSPTDPETLPRFLSEDPWRESFVAFLRKSFSDENYRFWYAVRQYEEEEDDAKRRALGLETYKTFLAESAEIPLNVDTFDREDVEKQLNSDSPPRDVFQVQCGMVTALLRDDSLPKYARSKEWAVLEAQQQELAAEVAKRKKKKQKRVFRRRGTAPTLSRKNVSKPGSSSLGNIE